MLTLLALLVAFEPDSAALRLVPDSLRTPLYQALVDAGSNWPELAQAVVRARSDDREPLVWLIRNMPHLDRLEMTSAILLEHMDHARLTQTEFPYPVPESLFRDYILAYRIADEPVTAWRRLLFERFAPLGRSAPTPEAAARAVNRWLSRNLRRQPRGFFGPMKSPELTLASGNGTTEEISVLACAILKTLGIPSRRCKVPWLGAAAGDTSWLEIHDRGRWLPLYPFAARDFGNCSALEKHAPDNVTIVEARSAFRQLLVTERYTGTGLVRVRLSSGGVPLAEFENFSFNVFNLGAWRALDELNTVTDSLGEFTCRLGDGDYLLTAGLRDPWGNPWFVNRRLTVRPDDSLSLDIDLTAPYAQIEPARSREFLLNWNFPDLSGGISAPAALKGRARLTLYFDPDSVGLRALRLLDSLHLRHRDSGLAVLAVGIGPAQAVRDRLGNWSASFPIAFIHDPGLDNSEVSLETLLEHPFAVPMPCCILADSTGKAVVQERLRTPADFARLRTALRPLLQPR